MIFYPFSVKIMLKMHQKRLAAGLLPDPLGSLSAPLNPLAAITGLLLRRGEGEVGKRGGEKGEHPITTDFLATYATAH